MRNFLAIATLALGIAASTAIFSFLDPLFLRPLTYPHADRLVTLESRDPQGNPAPVSYPDFTDAKQSAALAAFDIGFFELTRVDQPEEIPGALVTANLFPLLGVAPALGRNFRDGEEGVVILSDAAWKRRFAADPDILGRTIDLDFARTPQVERFTVIGVMPPRLWMYYGNFEVFVPLARNVIRDDRRAHLLTVVGRLPGGATPAQLQSVLASIPTEKNWTLQVRSWTDRLRQPVRTQLLVLTAGAALLLAIACANVAALLIVRAHSRRREMAIRAALGATPARLTRLFLADSLRLGLLAAALAIPLAYATVQTMTAVLPPDIELTRMLPGIDRVAINPSALAFAILIAILTCLAAAAYPSIQIRRAGLRASFAPSTRGRSILVAAEVALAVVLLSDAGLLAKTMSKIRAIDLGFRPEKLLVLRVPPPRTNFSPSYYDHLVTRIAALPGVESAARMSSLTPRSREIAIRGQKLTADYEIAGPAYFATLRIPLRRGRFFTPSDRACVVINETFSRRLFPDGHSIGQSILLDNRAFQITGIAADTRTEPFRDPAPLLYISTTDDPRAAQLAIRSVENPLRIAQSVRSTVKDLGGVVAEIGTMQHFLENSTWQQEQAATMMTAFAALALALASIGLYGVLAFTVARRTREIGIRIAIGARRTNVIALILSETARPVLIGLSIGLAAAFASGRFLSALLCQVTPADPSVLAMVALAIILAALAAVLVPLRRALTIHPNSALRIDT